MSLRRIEMFILTVLLLFMLLLLFGTLSAQAQSSLAVSAEGSFSSTTEAIYTRQNPFDQAGVLVELRHIWNPLFGYEVAYSVNRANQRYTYIGPSTTGPAPQTVRAYNHEISADWVVSLPLANFRPFALAGGGVQIFEPAGGQTGTQSDTKAVIVYGAGVDWEFMPHIGLRLQYRGNLYKAPDLAMVFPSTDQLVHNAQPSAGIFLRF
jgi:opacity protein-like surface antigen